MKLNEIYNLMERIDSTFRDFMFLNEDLILEAASLADVYQKYYSQIPEEEFRQIVSADPTSGDDKMGKYSKWLLALYTSGNLKLEDLYKVTDYLTLFHKYKAKLEKKDIGQYKSLPDLYDAIQPYEDGTQAASHKEEVRQIKKGAKKVYEDDEWLIIIPETEEAAIEYGKGTKWCTAATGGHNMFDYYSKQGPLYININKRTGRKYQFHFESNQFMDETDRQIPSIFSIGLSDDAIEFYKKSNPKGFLEMLHGDVEEALDFVEERLAEGNSADDVFLNIFEIKNCEYRCGLIGRTNNMYSSDDNVCVLIDKTDSIITPPFIYEDEGEGFLVIKDVYGDGYNLLNLQTLDYMFNWDELPSYVDSFDGGVAKVEKDYPRSENYIKTDGTYVSEEWYEDMYQLRYGDTNFPFVVSNGNGKNLMDINGNLLLDTWYADFKLQSNEEYIEVTNNERLKNLIGVNSEGKYTLLIDGWYEFVGFPHKGLCLVSQHGKKNIFNIYTQEFAFNDFDYDEIMFMGLNKDNEGFIALQLNHKLNIADIRSGKVKQLCNQWLDKINTAFDKDGICVVQKDNKYYFMDKNGNFMNKTGFDKIKTPIFGTNIYIASLNNKSNCFIDGLKQCFNPWINGLLSLHDWETGRLQKKLDNPYLLVVDISNNESKTSEVTADNTLVLDLSKGTIDMLVEFLQRNGLTLEDYWR